MIRLLAFGLLLVSALSAPAAERPVPLQPTAPVTAEPYLDLAVTYAVHARSLWQDGDVGGYWGGGVGEKDRNGAVRGMCNTMLGHAVLVHAWDAGWLQPKQREELTSAGLDRNGLLRYIRANLQHIIAHHTSAEKSLLPLWGDDWQSSLWLSAAGYAVLFTWDDIPPELKDGLRRMARREADRIAAAPVRDYKPGNTGAEENAWDTLALALALALEPRHPDAGKWFKALQAYAANTYSVPADARSTATLGAIPVREIVTTRNLFDDFTLDNHGFFHPDYVQVSGQHLGESWQLLTLGDRLNGTDYAARFLPFSRHHLADVWEKVLKPLLLHDGEFAFPSGNDWTFHCSMNQSYLAFIATALQDPLAQLAEERAIDAALKRREVSPPGRILGDSNLEWWWEPLLIKRCSTALLHHILSPAPEITAETDAWLTSGSWARLWPDSKIYWVRQAPEYYAALSWGKRRMGYFGAANGGGNSSYLTLPTEDGILPKTVVDLIEAETIRTEDFHWDGAVLQLEHGRRCALVCLPNSAVWIGPTPFRPLGIENHKLTGPERTIYSQYGRIAVPALTPKAPFDMPGNWVNINNELGLVAAATGFRYTPAGKYNRRSVGVDQVVPVAEWGAWQMIRDASADQTKEAAQVFSASLQDGRATVRLLDGSVKYEITADLGDGATSGSSTGRGVRGRDKSSHPDPLKSVRVQRLESLD